MNHRNNRSKSVSSSGGSEDLQECGRSAEDVIYFCMFRNYIDVLSKVVSSIIANRLSEHLVSNGLDAQAGFSKGKGCDDALAALKIGLQKLKDRGHDSYLLFVDIVKAFDSVNREMLWKILAKYGLPATLITVIKKMYNNIEVTLKYENESAEFISTSGVKQGDNLAPVLLHFVMQAVFDSLEKNWPNDVERPKLFLHKSKFLRPTKANENKQDSFDFWRSLYADDAAMVFSSRTSLITGTRIVNEEFRKFGLRMHVGDLASGEKSKTEAMFVPSLRSTETLEEATADFDVEEGVSFVSFCQEFKYLGTMLTPDLDDAHDISRRINLGTYSFRELSDVLLDRRINLKLRSRLFLQIPVNVALWGCTSWTIQAGPLDRLKKWYYKCCRKILGVTLLDKWRTKDVLAKLDVPDIESIIRVRQLKLIRKITAGGPNLELLQNVVCGQASGKGTARSSTTSTWMDSLQKGGIIAKDEKKAGQVTLSKLDGRFNTRGMSQIVEENLGLKRGAFKLQKRRNPRRY